MPIRFFQKREGGLFVLKQLAMMVQRILYQGGIPWVGKG